MPAEQPLSPKHSLDVSISRAETELVRLLDWVRAAESRIALVVPLSTAMLGALAVLVPTMTKWSLVSVILSSGSTLFLILSIAFAAWACFPRTTGPSGSLIFFGTIAAMKLNQYEQEVGSMTSADYLVDVIRQCHRNAPDSQLQVCLDPKIHDLLVVGYTTVGGMDLHPILSETVMGLSEDVSGDVQRIIRTLWNTRKGQKVPTTSGVALAGGAVELDATFLYADLAHSSKIAKELDRRVAAKILKAFLATTTRLVRHHGGTIVSFDGDRILGVFVGEFKNTTASKCALNINYTVCKIIRPKFEAKYETVKQASFAISHGVGLDTGLVLAVTSRGQG